MNRTLAARSRLAAKAIIEHARTRRVLHLPTDAVVADAFDADATARTVALDQVGDAMILDIGPATGAAYGAVLRAAKTIVFNGPMGVYERTPYQAGTRAVGEAIADATRAGAVSVVGGGDAAAAAHELGFAGAMTHVSTGGGATLEFLEGRTLPGVAALERRTVPGKPLVAGNWKMHKTSGEAVAFVRELRALDPDLSRVERDLPLVHCAGRGAPGAGREARLVWAQTMWYTDAGPFTGEVAGDGARQRLRPGCYSRSLRAAPVLRRAGRPRRQEGRRRARARLNRSSPSAKRPTTCCGPHQERARSADPRGAGRTLARRVALRGRLRADLGDRHRARRADTPEGASTVMAEIRAAVPGLERTRILYGGSVKPENIARCSRSRTSTARWSAARVSNRPRSQHCCQCRGGRMSKHPPLVLAILDGWGLRDDAHGNAIAAAELPNWRRILAQYPHGGLEASGEAVGLPAGVMGNSEVGRINIGSGRVVPQGLVVIDDAIADGTFATNPVLQSTLAHAPSPPAERSISSACSPTARSTARSITLKR